ncbi:MAG TPA: hypothetical protein VGI35_11085 [Steroidobacteraceae bacterium]
MIQTSRCAPNYWASGRLLVCTGIALAAVALAGCHHGITKSHSCNKPQPYARAQSIPPLQMPPGIDTPDTHAALNIPSLNEPAPPPRSRREPCLDEPPPFTAPGTSGRRVPSG